MSDATVEVLDAGDASAKPKRASKPRNAVTGAPTPKELAAVLSKALGLSSVLMAAVIGIEELAMTPDEAQAIADPAARLLARAQWAKKLTQHMGASSDAIDLVFALSLYGMRVYPLVMAKLESDRQHGNATAAARAVRQASNAGGASGAPGASLVGGVSIPGEFDPLEIGLAIPLR